jgi:hypothetical protein
VDELDAVGIDHGEERRIGQEALGLGRVDAQGPQQQGEQQADGDQLARP